MAGLIALCAILALGLFYSLWRHARYRSQAQRLSQEISDFLAGRIKSPAFSVRDDAFAPLENGVVELENRLLQLSRLRESLAQGNRQIVADLSHQLKTPLSSLRLYCEMDGAEHLPQQIQLIERMERLISALLRLEKLEAGAFDFQFAPCQLHEVVQALVSSFQLAHPAKRFIVRGQVRLRCDTAFIREALSNLIKNACEHTGPEGRIEIAMEQKEGLASITVQDDGGGLPEAELPLFFRRFYRSSAARGKEGAGIGLAITLEIIRRHHGSIRVENAAGGLRFSILLPDLSVNLKET